MLGKSKKPKNQVSLLIKPKGKSAYHIDVHIKMVPIGESLCMY